MYLCGYVCMRIRVYMDICVCGYVCMWIRVYVDDEKGGLRCDGHEPDFDEL